MHPAEGDLRDGATGGQFISNETLSLAVLTSKKPSFLTYKCLKILSRFLFSLLFFFFLKEFSEKEILINQTLEKRSNLRSNQVKLIQTKTFKKIDMVWSEALKPADNFDITWKDEPFCQGGPDEGNDLIFATPGTVVLRS